MNARKLTLELAVLAVVLTTASALSFVGCGGDNSNPGPDASHRDSSGGTDSPAADSPNHPDGSTPEGSIVDGGTDTNVPDVSLDTGSCKSDSSSCNSCYTDAQVAADPYNGCSPYTKNCVGFTTPVPSHPTL